eukprot:3307-Heterococcus_DN1.PRE.3
MEFKLRDLALLLPDEVGDAESLRYTKDATAMEAPAQMLQPRIDPTKKVVIYRAGQVCSHTPHKLACSYLHDDSVLVVLSKQ